MKKLFIIAPYKFDDLFEQKRKVLFEISSKLGIDVVFAEDKKTSTSLNAEETIKLINNSDYFIADLSFERPSCYYELGYLQSRNKNVIIIAQRKTHIHQLLNKDKVLYFNDILDYSKLVKKIMNRLIKY